MPRWLPGLSGLPWRIFLYAHRDLALPVMRPLRLRDTWFLVADHEILRHFHVLPSSGSTSSKEVPVEPIICLTRVLSRTG